MADNMKKFMEAISQSEELTAKISTMSKEELIALAKEMGIELAAADLEKPVTQELCDDELDLVAGGSRCICSFGGGGKADDEDKTCACVMDGGGEFKNGDVRCVCIIGGEGLS